MLLMFFVYNIPVYNSIETAAFSCASVVYHIPLWGYAFMNVKHLERKFETRREWVGLLLWLSVSFTAFLFWMSSGHHVRYILSLLCTWKYIYCSLRELHCIYNICCDSCACAFICRMFHKIYYFVHIIIARREDHFYTFLKNMLEIK